LKVWTKVEISDSLDYYSESDEFEFKCSIAIQAWEIYDEECDIEHENWTRFNENWEVVATVSGVVRNDKGQIQVEYCGEDYEEMKSNLLVQRSIKEAMNVIKNALDDYFE
jgi:hypothetical protein